MEQTLRANLQVLADAFMAETGQTIQKIGEQALNDRSYLPRVLGGDGFTIRTHDRVVLWLSANWPKGLVWPAGVERPDPKLFTDSRKDDAA